MLLKQPEKHVQHSLPSCHSSSTHFAFMAAAAKLSISADSAITMLVGFPAPCPPLVSIRATTGFVWGEFREPAHQRCAENCDCGDWYDYGWRKPGAPYVDMLVMMLMMLMLWVKLKRRNYWKIVENSILTMMIVSLRMGPLCGQDG